MRENLVGFVGLDFEGLFSRSIYSAASGTFTYPAELPARGQLVIHRDGAWSARYTIDLTRAQAHAEWLARLAFTYGEIEQMPQRYSVDREAEGRGAGSLDLYLRDVRDALDVVGGPR